MLTPLSFITGFFGMNVHFPGYNSWAAFVAAIGVMLVTVIGMLGFFRWKRWL